MGEDDHLVLQVSRFDASHIPQGITSVMGKGVEVSLSWSRSEDPHELVGTFADFENRSCAYDEWYPIQSDGLNPELPNYQDFTNPHECVAELHGYIRRECQRFSELHPERAVAPDAIPANPALALKLVLELHRYHLSQSESPTRICVKWPGHDGEL